MTDISAMTPTERLALITRRGSAPTPAHLVVPFKMAAAGEFIGAPVAARFFPEMNANEIFEAVPIYIADLSPNFPPVPCVQLDLALMMRYAMPMTASERAQQLRAKGIRADHHALLPGCLRRGAIALLHRTNSPDIESNG